MPFSGLWLTGKSAELLHEGEKIGYAPMLGNLAVPHAHDVHGLKRDFAACWRDAEKLSLMRAMVGLVGRHAVAIGKLPLDGRVEVRERRAEDLVKLARARLVRRAPGLWRMVEEIVGEEFIEHREISAALHFLGISSHDSLRGFTRAAHDAPPIA